MKVSDVSAALETIAPPRYAEEWDNVGLLLGDADAPCRRVLLCVDLTAAVLAEARQARTDLVMAYHPPLFKPATRITKQAAPIAYAALRAGLAVYSVHTAYDAAIGGANDALADALGMGPERRPLQPRQAEGAYKVAVFVPPHDLPAVADAAFAAGAGQVGRYRECAWASPVGFGSFYGEEGARPAIGRPGRREYVEERRWETLVPPGRLSAVLAAIRAAHSYEEPAIDVVRLAAPSGEPAGAGLGRVGTLRRPASMKTLLARVRDACGTRSIQLVTPNPAPSGRRQRDRAARLDVAIRGRFATPPIIRTLAVGCGSCGPLFRAAVAAGADLYVTGELRHHDALAAAAARLTVACVGHSHSERLTLRPLADSLRRLLPGLRVVLSHADRDPFAIV